jgi:hypothetical protein
VVIKFIKNIKFSYNIICLVFISSMHVITSYLRSKKLLSLRYSLTFIYGNVINKAKKFKSDTSKLINSLKNLIRKSYDLATIVRPSKRNVARRNKTALGPREQAETSLKIEDHGQFTSVYFVCY